MGGGAGMERKEAFQFLPTFSEARIAKKCITTNHMLQREEEKQLSDRPPAMWSTSGQPPQGGWGTHALLM